MSSNQEEPTKDLTTDDLNTSVNQVKSKITNLLGSWKLKVTVVTGLIVTIIAAAFLITFFWQHEIAVMGMKSWSSHSGAKPIDCMIKDTNSDQYISCSSLLDGQVVPLECGASIFNIGCRINYGAAAAAPVIQQQPK